MTISNISLVSVWVKDISESKAFYVDVLGFEEQEDIQLAEDFRWCTVRHPRQPELSVHLTTPSKPLSDDLVAAMQRGRAARHRPGRRRLPRDVRGADREGRRVHPAPGRAPLRRGGADARQLGQLDGAGRAPRRRPVGHAVARRVRRQAAHRRG